MAKKDPADFGHPGLARHFTVVPVFSSPGTMIGKVVDESEADRLLLRDEITSTQHATLADFAKHLHKAGYFAMKSPNYDSPIHLDPALVGDRKASLVRSMVKIVRGLDEKIGPAKRRALIDLCLMDRPWQGDDLVQCINALDRVMRG